MSSTLFPAAQSIAFTVVTAVYGELTLTVLFAPEYGPPRGAVGAAWAEFIQSGQSTVFIRLTAWSLSPFQPRSALARPEGRRPE